MKWKFARPKQQKHFGAVPSMARAGRFASDNAGQPVGKWRQGGRCGVTSGYTTGKTTRIRCAEFRLIRTCGEKCRPGPETAGGLWDPGGSIPHAGAPLRLGPAGHQIVDRRPHGFVLEEHFVDRLRDRHLDAVPRRQGHDRFARGHPLDDRGSRLLGLLRTSGLCRSARRRSGCGRWARCTS